jgi:hypothetical protein
VALAEAIRRSTIDWRDAMKKTVAAAAAALTAAGAMAAAAILANPATAAAPKAPTAHPAVASHLIHAADTAGPADSAHLTATALPLPPITYSYGQAGPTVSIYKRTAAIATVTPTSITYNGTTGTLKLKVTAKSAVSFKAGQFVWEDPDGGDHDPQNAGHTLKFAKNSSRTVAISYEGVGAGDIFWSPDGSSVAGDWVFSTSGAAITAGPASPEPPTGYAQDKKTGTVSVYRAGHVLATVTPKSTTYTRTKGTLKLTVTAKAKFSLKNGQFIWEDPDGGDHTASNPGKAYHLKKDTTRTISISFDGAGKGDIIWVPKDDLVTGIWAVKAN